MQLSTQKKIIGFLSLLVVLSFWGVFHLKFSFSFEQFFPQGDPDLEFFNKYVKDFEADDNFLMVGVRRDSGVFEEKFLHKFHDFCLKANGLSMVKGTQSLTELELPVKVGLGLATIPAIHIDDTSRYEEDKGIILRDERFVRNLIDTGATTLVCVLKTVDQINLEDSELFLGSLDSLIKTYHFEDYHYLGRANFQKELIAMEKREVLISSMVAAVLVGIIMFLIFRRFWSVFVALLSIGVSMLFFMGLLGAAGRELSAMAALYPVLMVIIGTSDVIHMMSKYIDELRLGHTKQAAIVMTVKEIGLATFMTAITTAVGFATMVTSRIKPIGDFGINSAIGVMVAYCTVLLITTAVLPFFEVDDLIKLRKGTTHFDVFMEWIYRVTKSHPRRIALISLGVLGISFIGISRIKTNYDIISNLPTRSKVTDDFKFFERVFAGFRPLEYGVFAQGGHKVDDFEVIQQVAKLEGRLRADTAIRSVNSVTMLYKSINMMDNAGNYAFYKLPEDKAVFEEQKQWVDKIPAQTTGMMMSKDKKSARIATRILDLGADTVMAVGDKIDKWIVGNTDSSVVKFRRTGTGYIIDKNAMYVRSDLLEGIAWEVGLIALLMGLMLRNFKMIVIFLIPNLFPLIFAGALVGFLGVNLDAGISLIFTVVFGIAIDDTIHFLSSFRLNQLKGESVDKALHTTLLETGKPVVLTTIILFFGFLVMMFSIHPPSVTVGKLIAVTLITALLSDLFINPILLRWWIRDKR
jgi:uncharacterized protein